MMLVWQNVLLKSVCSTISWSWFLCPNYTEPDGGISSHLYLNLYASELFIPFIVT